MPPKPKFTKEEMVGKALRIVEEKGASALTARELGKALGSSTRPIFTIFFRHGGASGGGLCRRYEKL